MTDISMNGAEVHAETPEEEREASLILNAVLSGKTTPADGCICPDANFPNVTFKPEFVNPRAARWCRM